MVGRCSIERFTRKKVLDLEGEALPRVLTILDLTALGIGSTIGVGFYVLAGEVAKNIAGPAVIISFLIAAVASLFAGLCYAEFGGRVPKAGSAYIYTYVCIGEFLAFVIGWNLILEYLIGTASIGAGFSGYIDTFFGGVIAESMNKTMPMNISFLAPYPDMLAFGLCILVSVVLAFGVKESSRMNNVITIINLVVVVFVIIMAATLANPANWSMSMEDVNDTCDSTDGYGTGGFSPYGFEGIMQGAATCFYGFVGFDVIASTGEEAIRPERSLPISIGISLGFIFIAYFGMSTVLTLALPYCLQDTEAPLLYLFQYFDMSTSEIIVSIGALFGFTASLFGALFPMPRIIYAMASDGLLFRVLSTINKRFRSPVIATLLSGFSAAIMAMLFDLEVLIHMMSIGTLQAYTIVALCVMMLRYSIDPTNTELESLTLPCDSKHNKNSIGSTHVQADLYSFRSYYRQALNMNKLAAPNKLSSSYVGIAILIFSVLCLITCVLLVTLTGKIKEGDPASIAACVVFFVLSFVMVVSISMQPQSAPPVNFKVPLVPWLPAMSCFFNLYLMCNLPANTWIKFVIWMVVGLAIYFFYAIWYDAPARIEAELHTKGRGSSTGRGSVNRGFDGSRSEATLEIPMIMVQPATPQSTMQKDVPPVARRPSREVVISPLVTAELAEKLRIKQEEEQRQQSVNEEQDHDEDKVENDEKARSDSKSSGDNDVIQHKEELVLGSVPPVVATALVTSVALDRKTSSDIRAEEDALQSFDNVINPHFDSGSGTPDPSGQRPESSIESEKSLNEETLKKLENSFETTSQHDETVSPENDTKVKLVLQISPLIDSKSNDKPDGLRTSQSASEMPTAPISPVSTFLLNNEFITPSEEPGIGKWASLDDISALVIRNKIIRTYSNDSTKSALVSTSVPGSPTSRRRRRTPPFPNKTLQRMSSFEFIPPSSPDSPLARRVNDFVVIPVAEPSFYVDDFDDDVSIGDKTDPSNTVRKEAQVVKELQNKLNKDQANVDGDVNDNKQDTNLLGIDKVETKGKDNSFEELIHSTESNSVNNLPDNVSVGETKEFQNYLDPLDRDLQTIRERGESKLLPDGSEPIVFNTGDAEAVTQLNSADKEANNNNKNNIDSSGTPEILPSSFDLGGSNSSESVQQANKTSDNSNKSADKYNPSLDANPVALETADRGTKVEEDSEARSNRDLEEDTSNKKPSVKDLQERLLRGTSSPSQAEGEPNPVPNTDDMKSSTSISELRKRFL